MKTSRTELCARMNKEWEDCKAFLENHRQADGTITAEDKAVYDEMVKKVDAYKAEIALLDDVEKRENEMNKGTSTPITNQPKSGDKKTGRSSDEYHKAFVDFLRGNLSAKDLKNVLQEGVGSKGGYLVPEEFEKQLVEKLAELNIFRQICHITPMGSSAKDIPIVADEGEAGWIGENGSYGEDDDEFTTVTMKAHKVGRLTRVSDELAEDSFFDIESYVLNSLAKSIAKAEEKAFAIGTGDDNGQPTGVFTNDGAGVGVTTAAADKFTADELIDLVFSVASPYRKNAGWVMNDQTAKLVRKLKDGQGNYIWQTSLVAGEPDRLLGYPVNYSAYAPTVEAGALVIAFGDFDYYWIGDRSGVDIKKLEELYAANGQIGFRGSRRTDGKITQSDAIKLLKMHA